MILKYQTFFSSHVSITQNICRVLNNQILLFIINILISFSDLENIEEDTGKEQGVYSRDTRGSQKRRHRKCKSDTREIT